MQEVAVKEQFKWVAKLGYASRGVIYLVVGSLAVLAAFGEGGETTDSKGALVTVLNQPFGNIMVIVLIAGLVSYSIWRSIQGIKDTDSHGTSAKGLGVRAGLLGSAVTHIFLAYWAAKLLITGNSGSDSSGGGWLASDYGPFLLGIAALVVLIVGIAHLYKGWTAKFEKYMAIPADKNKWARPICRFGLISRGVVWCIIAWFLIKSAIGARANEIDGMAAALESLQGAGYGPWLLAIVAAGLFAFGVYSLLESIYRRINFA